MIPSETGPVPPAATQPAKIRVAHVVDSLAGSGGAENRLVEEIVAIGDRFDHLVVRLFERDFLQGRLEAAGVPVVGLGFQADTPVEAGRSPLSGFVPCCGTGDPTSSTPVCSPAIWSVS